MKDRGSNPRWRVFYIFIFSPYISPTLTQRSSTCFLLRRGCSSYGRAFALHARGTGIDTPHLHFNFFLKIYTILLLLFCNSTTFFILSKKLFIYKKTTTAGFEPTLPKGNCLAGNRLNHSATLSFYLSFFILHFSPFLFFPLSISFVYYKIFFSKTTVAGFEPTHPEDN